MLFLLSQNREVLYGGAAGGGKSVALLMAALMYVHVPGYSALLLRRNYQDLALPRALIDLSFEALGGTDAHWDGQHRCWRFPSGAVLQFGYLEAERDKYRYQSAQFQFIAFDELTQFTESQYSYLFSRLRRAAGVDVPLRMRAATNPGGVGHDWVHRRFIDAPARGVGFVPAKMTDNPYLDLEAYRESLSRLDPVTRAQLERGDWDIRPAGNLFKPQWFEFSDPPPAGRIACRVRYWDLAATAPKPGYEDPDWSVGLRACISYEGVVWVEDVRRFRETPSITEQLVRQTAVIDGPDCAIRIEREGGSSGPALISHYQTRVLPGYDVQGVAPAADKVTRSQPASAAAQRGEIKIARAGATTWAKALLDELAVFPNAGSHDDQVDALSGAYRYLIQRLRAWDMQEPGVRRGRRQILFGGIRQ